MIYNKISSRVQSLIKSAAMAAVMPILFIYIMIAKPDYTIMNALAHIVLPAAETIGDIVTWPVRAFGGRVQKLHELSELRAENEELHKQLQAALRNQVSCDIAIRENQKMARELDIVQNEPYDVVLADIVHDNTAFHHSNFFINKGSNQGLSKGMIAVSLDGTLVGIIIDSGKTFSRVRAINDSESNIAVRVVGSEIYGFMSGNGGQQPTIGFFSDPDYQPTSGTKLVTSNISGILPAGIPVGTIINNTDVDIVHVSRLSRVMILKFNIQNEYK